jgi:glycerol kinase
MVLSLIVFKEEEPVSHILALDQGTSSSRAIVFDPAGTIAGAAQREFEQIFPKPGWVEHNPEAIWESQLSVAREALASANLGPGDIAGIGVTNQRETVVVWERESGKPIHNAIVWQDRRTAECIAQLKSAGHEPMVTKKTGLVLDPYFSATKIKWLLDNVPGARKRAIAGELAAGTIDSWLIHRLTGGARHLTDITNASRTLLLNIHTGDWDAELLELFDIPASLLPEVCSSSSVLAETEKSLFGKPIPIAGVAGDQQAALFGQMCTRPGMVKNTYGTGCFILTPTGQKAVTSKNRLLTTVAWKIGEEPIEYCLEGSIFMGGASIQWLRDGLGIIKTAPEVNQLASTVPDSGGVYLVPAFVGLGAPHWDPAARGTLLGMTRGTTAAHIARATLECIAYQVADVFQAMEADIGAALSELRVDGGASASDLLMQLQADILGMRIERPSITETTVCGAAYLAGLAVGVWKDIHSIEGEWKRERSFEPAMSPAKREKQLAGWGRAVERAKGWAEG